MTSPVLLAVISSQRRREKKKKRSFLLDSISKKSYLSHKWPRRLVWYLFLTAWGFWGLQTTGFVSMLEPQLLLHILFQPCIASPLPLSWFTAAQWMRGTKVVVFFSEVYFKFTWHLGGTQSWRHVWFLAWHAIKPTKILRKDLTPLWDWQIDFLVYLKSW